MKYSNMIPVILLALCGATARPMSNEPGFSLHNKSNKKILVQVQNNVGIVDKLKSGLVIEGVEVAPNAFYDKKIDITKKTTMTLYTIENQRPYYRATFSLNKTIYVNWDGQKLYHQKGPLMGIMGKTDRGYSLKNNIADNDIQLVAIK